MANINIPDENVKGSSVSSIKIFENPEFGKVRACLIDGDPWFVGKDVASILGYLNTKSALKQHVREKNRKLVQLSDIQTGSSNTPLSYYEKKSVVTIINEAGLYEIMMKSSMPNAEPFQDWVTEEVLPSIRKTGTYSIAGIAVPNFSNPAEAARAWADLYEKRAIAEKAAEEALKEADGAKRQRDTAIGTLREQADDVAFARAYIEPKGILIRNAAKVLGAFGVVIAVKSMYQYMPVVGIAFRNSNGCWEPYAKAVDGGWCVASYDKGDEDFDSKMSVKITAKGFKHIFRCIMRSPSVFAKYGRVEKDFPQRVSSYNVEEVIDGILSA